MSVKIFGETFIWAGASQLQGGYFALLSVQKGEDRALYAVIREPSYATLELAHEAAIDAVNSITSIDDEDVITLGDGSKVKVA